MLGQIFIGLSRIRALKKVLWRTWYQYLTNSWRSPEWTFMNYGYIGNNLLLAEEDEKDRCCIQLYRQTVGGIDLTGKDVLEVGSGRGGGSSFIKRYLYPARMIGVDLSRN